MEPVPSSACPFPARRRSSSAATPESTGPMAAIASIPRSGRDPCAARPSVSTSNATNPLCAIATTSSVGSATIAASRSSGGRGLPCRRCRPPRRRPRVDDDVAAQAVASRRGADQHDRGERALHVAGAAPVQAAVVLHRGEGALHPRDADGVHVRVEQERGSAARAPRDRRRRSAVPARPRSRSTSSPACRSQPATNAAISASPAPPGTRSGFVESMATSCPVQLGEARYAPRAA